MQRRINDLYFLFAILTLSAQPIAAGSYDRGDWEHWIDTDRDCQNTRHEILIKTSKVKVTFKDEKECAVKKGKWLDLYTGEKFKDPAKLDIDHIVPLSEAHKSGGEKWNKETKKQFANDPLNLTVTDRTTNRQKSDKTPLEWMPPEKKYHCEYATKWKMIKEKYQLTFQKNELISLNLACQ